MKIKKFIGLINVLAGTVILLNAIINPITIPFAAAAVAGYYIFLKNTKKLTKDESLNWDAILAAGAVASSASKYLLAPELTSVWQPFCWSITTLFSTLILNNRKKQENIINIENTNRQEIINNNNNNNNFLNNKIKTINILFDLYEKQFIDKDSLSLIIEKINTFTLNENNKKYLNDINFANDNINNIITSKNINAIDEAKQYFKIFTNKLVHEIQNELNEKLEKSKMNLKILSK